MTGNALRIRTGARVEISTTDNAVAAERNNAVAIEMQKSVSGLHLVYVARNARRTEVREGTTGRPVAVSAAAVRLIAPRIMAVAEPVGEAQPVPLQTAPQPKVELAFYRKYTEAMLRRYLRLSVEVGRVPSVMGRELFRGNVSHYKAASFEDGVVFCVDVERCLAKLGKSHLRLLQRIALQGYTLQEAAPLLGLDFRRCHEQYGVALDELTQVFLTCRLLEPQKCCQDVETV